MQLDLFIRSFKVLVEDANDYTINVLYTCSNDNFRRGYEKVISAYPNVEFFREYVFKNDLLTLIIPYREFTVFFVDDNVFKNPIDFYDDQMDVFRNNHHIICRSLRLGYNLNYCYPAKVRMTPPQFDSNGVFAWRGQTGDYGYPFSVDGHVFFTDTILPILQKTEFTNPNTMEGNIQHTKTDKDLMVCYPESVIFNNPINKVQMVNDNIHGKITAEWLNAQYLNGKRINLSTFVGLKNTSCHQEMPIILEDEGNGN
jgi:hypothetical protein